MIAAKATNAGSKTLVKIPDQIRETHHPEQDHQRRGEAAHRSHGRPDDSSRHERAVVHLTLFQPESQTNSLPNWDEQ